ncbi:MAG: AAA family ATPase [Thalassobaculum sp.]
MDHGKLTDHNGKHVDFRNVILIMTTNAGAADLAKAAIGFARSSARATTTEAINRMFTPEFRNRLDAIVGFEALGPETIGRVVDKFVIQLEAQLADRGVTIEASAQAPCLARREGLRPSSTAPGRSARVIQEHIKKPLAEELLFGRLVKGGVVRIGLVDGKLAFDFDDEPTPKKPAKPTKGRKGGNKGGDKVEELVE